MRYSRPLTSVSHVPIITLKVSRAPSASHISLLSALRLAVSIGGDSDTLAAITGGIAETYYGISKDIENQALTYLPEEFQQVIWEFREKVKNNKKKLPL